MLIRFQIFFIFTSLFVSIGKSQNVGFSNSEADQKARRDIEISKIDVFSKSPYVFDGQAKSSYCYKSRSGEILHVFKFEIKHIFKGKEDLSNGDIYIIQKNLSGLTQDGSKVGVSCSSPEIGINVGQKNVILFCNSYLDTTILPPNFPVLQGVLLIPDYVINVRTMDEVSPNEYWGSGGYFINHFINNADSLYSYLNSKFPFIEKRKVEPNDFVRQPKNKIKMEDTVAFGYPDLQNRPEFPGGWDSLSKIVVKEFRRELLPGNYFGIKFNVLVIFYVNPDGSLYRLIVDCNGIKAIEDEIFRIIYPIKSFRPAIHKNGKIVKSYGLIYLDLFFN